MFRAFFLFCCSVYWILDLSRCISFSKWHTRHAQKGICAEVGRHVACEEGASHRRGRVQSGGENRSRQRTNQRCALFSYTIDMNSCLPRLKRRAVSRLKRLGGELKWTVFELFSVVGIVFRDPFVRYMCGPESI